MSLAAKHGQLVHALAVYRLMLRDGVEPKSPTFNARESRESELTWGPGIVTYLRPAVCLYVW